MPCAVFMRQLYPIEGIDLMKKNRPVKIGKNYKNLVDGPSKLCIALQISKNEFNGTDSCAPDAALFFSKGEKVPEDKNVLQRHDIVQQLYFYWVPCCIGSRRPPRR